VATAPNDEVGNCALRELEVVKGRALGNMVGAGRLTKRQRGVEAVP
jgi:hypothetical protein